MKSGAEGSPLQRQRSEPSRALYWTIAVVIALPSVRYFIRLLVDAGLATETDAAAMFVITFPVALLTIGRLAPGKT